MSSIVPEKTIPVSAIGSVLKESVRAAELQGYTNTGQANLVILCDPSGRIDIDAWIRFFAEVHPCRIFILIPIEGASEMNASIQTWTHELSRTVTVSIQSITLCFSPEQFPAIPSILRAHSITGVPLELFLPVGGYNEFRIASLNERFESVFFDSKTLTSFSHTISTLSNTSRYLVDMQWIALSPWRETIKVLCDRIAGRTQLSKLERVEIECGEEDYMQAMLLAGGILARLKFHLQSYGKYGFECWQQGGKTLSVFIRSGKERGIQELSFFGSSNKPFLKLTEGKGRQKGERKLLGVVYGEDGFQMTTQYESLIEKDALSRYFLVGESTTNYHEAFLKAYEMNKLRKAFLGV